MDEKMSNPLTRYNSIRTKVENPFINHTKYPSGVMAWSKVALGAVFLMPLRIIALSCLMSVGVVTAACMNLLTKDKRQPMKYPALLMRPILQGCFRISLTVLGFYTINVKGKACSAEEAPILVVAPHSALLDFLYIGYQNFPCPVSRKENEDVPIIGQVVRALQPISVSRQNPNSRKDTVDEINQRARSNGAWPQIVIFPEGTCTNARSLISFKRGAFLPGAPVQPVLLSYQAGDIDLSWVYAGAPMTHTFLLMLCQWSHSLTVEYLPVYNPSMEERSDANLYMKNVRNLMAKVLQVPVTEHSFEDVRLQAESMKASLPAEAGVIEYLKIHERLGLGLEEITKLLKQFEEMDADNDGFISFEEFSHYLGLPPNEHVRVLFETYDTDHSGFLDFRKYLVGLKVDSSPTIDPDSINFAFQAFDTKNRGRIDRKSFHRLLNTFFPEMTKQDSNKLFQRVDADGNGEISYTEFEDFAQQHPEFGSLFAAFTKE